MPQRTEEYDRIRDALADADEPLTAREILRSLDARGESVESVHRVATVLGRAARDGDVTVIRSSPYRYRLDAQSGSGS